MYYSEHDELFKVYRAKKRFVVTPDGNFRREFYTGQVVSALELLNTHYLTTPDIDILVHSGYLVELIEKSSAL